jgi:acyl carrier protein
MERMQVVDIEAEIRSYLSKKLPVASENGLRDEDPLLGGVLDSNGVIELVEFLQERFGITVDDEDITMENLDSVKNAAAFVSRKISTKA